MDDPDDLDDPRRDNLGKLWWSITILLAAILWFLASYALYLLWYEDDLATPRTLFNPFTNLANFLVCLTIAWLIMIPFRPEAEP